MAQPYIGEIRMFGGNFAPAGWMVCAGQPLPIAENETLFQLIGTTYGGDGEQNFNLPDLRGRIPLHRGGGFTFAEADGVETVTLTTQQIPFHSHPFQGSNAVANDPNPTGNTLGESSAISLFQSEAPAIPMAAAAIGATGNNEPHDNRQPYLCVNFIISLFGIFPSQT